MSSSIKITSSAGGAQLLELVQTVEGRGIRLEGSGGLGRTTLMFDLYERLRESHGLLVGATRFESAFEAPMLSVLAAVGELLGQGLGRAGLSSEQLVERMPPELSRSSRALLRVSAALGASRGTGEPGSRWRMRELGEVWDHFFDEWLKQPTLHEELLCRLLVTAHRELSQRLGKLRMVLIFDQIERAARVQRRLVETLCTLTGAGIYCVVSYSDERNALNLPLSPCLLALEPVTLEPWSAVELVKGYQQLGGNRGREGRQLSELTQGSPLSLRSLVWLERCRPNQVHDPVTLQAALPAMLEMISTPARELLGLLSLMPAPLQISRPELAGLLKLDVSTIDPMIQGLRQQGLLGQYPRTLVLAQNQIRAAVFSSLTPEHLSELGARLAQFLETQHARDLERRAQTPYLGAFQRALLWAGQYRGAFRAATELCEGALAWEEWEVARAWSEPLEQLGSALTHSEKARLLNVRGRIAHALKEFEAAEQAFSQAQELAVAGNEPLAALQIRLNRCAAVAESGQLSRARELLREWLLDGSGVGEELVWEVWQLMGQLELQEGATEEAVNAWVQAVAAADALGLAQPQAKLRISLAELLLALGRLDRGILYLQQALELTQRDEERTRAASLSARLAVVYEIMGNLVLAEESWKSSLQRVEEHGQLESMWCTLAAGLGGFLRRQGRIAEAVDLLQRALALTREAGRVLQEARLLAEAAQAYEALEELKIAIEYAQQSLSLRRSCGDIRALGLAANAYGTLLHRTAQPERARAAFLEALRAFESSADLAAQSVVLNNLGVVSALLGDVKGALQYHQRALIQDEAQGDLGSLRHTLANLTILQEGRGSLSDAEDLLRRLIALDRELEHPDLAREETYLTMLTRRARQTPSPRRLGQSTLEGFSR